MSMSSLRSAAILAVLLLSGCAAATKFIRDALRYGELDGGEQVGEWTYWYENGQKKAQGQYRDDHQIGRWTYWYENGAVEWEGGFDEQRLEGPSAFYFEDGTLHARGEFREGFEEGRWTFWTADGTKDQAGDFVEGRPSQRWTYWHPDGSLRAEGFRYRGEKVGLWQYWDEGGSLYERRYPLPDELRIVFETAEDGTLRREGFVGPAGPEGRWISYHENGQRRAEGDFVRGRQLGNWSFLTSRGELLARGHMQKGHFMGNWTVWPAGIEERLDGRTFPDPRPAEAYARDELADTAKIGVVLSTFAGEIAAPVEAVADQSLTPGADGPPDELALGTEQPPSVPLRAQPWTERERKSLDYLVSRYTEGAEAATPPAGDRRYGRGGGRSRRGGASATAGGQSSFGDEELAKPWIGKRLPHTVFRTGEDTQLNLDDLRGEKNVVLIVLRGFVREVCVYCVTQTEALCNSIDEFQARGAEVLVVYPGERNRLDAFLESFATVTDLEGEIPVGVLYDPDASLVRAMNIEDELAIPSTFILDAEGTIQYAYVGTAIEDRPPCKDLLKVLDGLSQQ